ncbi:unnamed protein product, partial [Ixodes persulcatus]
MMSTVLPTPAPPKRPILPPWKRRPSASENIDSGLIRGASRSTTLMPVTRISCSTLISTNSGASWWIERNLSERMGPRSSMGSPMTFMMRPRVPGPTGTMMGDCVSVTFWPRTRPSVPSMAIVRTTFSPE